jgi:hypothetical protein
MKNRYIQVNPLNRAFLPVCHSTEVTEAVDNARTAKDNGADGIWLAGKDPSMLVAMYRAIRQQMNPNFWVGIHPTVERPMECIGLIPDTVDGLWLSDVGITTINRVCSYSRLHGFAEQAHRTHPDTLLFADIPHSRDADLTQFYAWSTRDYIDALVIPGNISATSGEEYIGAVRQHADAGIAAGYSLLRRGDIDSWGTCNFFMPSLKVCLTDSTVFNPGRISRFAVALNPVPSVADTAAPAAA